LIHSALAFLFPSFSNLLLLFDHFFFSFFQYTAEIHQCFWNLFGKSCLLKSTKSLPLPGVPPPPHPNRGYSFFPPLRGSRPLPFRSAHVCVQCRASQPRWPVSSSFPIGSLNCSPPHICFPVTNPALFLFSFSRLCFQYIPGLFRSFFVSSSVFAPKRPNFLGVFPANPFFPQTFFFSAFFFPLSPCRGTLFLVTPPAR